MLSDDHDNHDETAPVDAEFVPVIEDNVFKRGAATILDIFILNGFLLFAILPAVNALGAPDTPFTQLIVVLAVTFVYFVGMWTWSGQTIGKKLFGMRVIGEDGHTMDFISALYRYTGFVVMTALMFLGFLLSGIFVIYTDTHQGLHDKFARTIVVRLR